MQQNDFLGYQTFGRWLDNVVVNHFISFILGVFFTFVLLPFILRPVGRWFMREIRGNKQRQEKIIDLLDTGTDGGLRDVVAAVDSLKEEPNDQRQ